MRNYRLIDCIIFLLLFVSVGYADNFNLNEKQILLKSRHFIPNEGISTSIQSELSSVLQSNKEIHVLMQFDNKLSEEEKEELRSNDVKLLAYVPNNAWFVSIPSDKTNDMIRKPFVRSIDTISIYDKISPYIQEGKIGNWAINEKGDVVLVVYFFKDVSLLDAEELIKMNQGTIYDRITSINALVIVIPKDKIIKLAENDFVQWIEQIPPPLTEVNDGARTTVGVNTIQSTPYQLDGSGIDVLVYDSGIVDSTHNDFAGRISYTEVGRSIDNHSTHVAGTVGGDGTQSAGTYKGMAPKVDIISYAYDFTGVALYNNSGDLNSNYQGAINKGADIATNSIGSNIALNNYDCAWEGDYETTSQLIDNIIGGSLSEPFTVMWAAGNERTAGSPSGRCGDNYSTIPPPAAAKNSVVVGATNDNDGMTSFSSWGPVDDGRIKPDVVAPGYNVYSTVIGNTYGPKSGTSMATPVVSGTASLMLQQFDCLKPYNVETPLPSTIKALLIHTAKDLNNTGPDYTTGYGRINATEAIDYIIYRYFREDNLSSGETDKYNFTINDSSKAVKVTLVWDDYPATPNADPTLVNDLDLYLKAPNGTIFKSWTLNPSNPSAPATKDGNHRDNVEQVYVPNPGSANLFNNGQWQIIVNATSCPQCPQKYSLIYKRPFQLNINLNWTFISIPIMPYDTLLNHTIPDNHSDIKRIYQYDGIGDSGWKIWFNWRYSYTPGYPDLMDDLNTIEPGKGYWILSNKSTILEINGDPITKNSASSTTSINLPQGWYTVGYNSFFEIPTNESFNNLDFHGYHKYRLGSDYEFDVYYNNGTFENVEFNLKPGRGAWIYMNSADTWTIPQTRSCPSVPSTIETFSGKGAETTNSPFVIYGYGVCDQELNKLNTNVVIRLRVNGTEITNYTMGDVAVNQYRLQVPVGAGVETNDIAEILINNVTIAEGNVTIGSSGAFYYLNISASQTIDSDGDGFSVECLDCNDSNSSINPNAQEICDGVDNDCDGYIDGSDSECDTTPTDLLVTSLQSTSPDGGDYNFEFIILNNGSVNLTNINWSINTGLNTINSQQPLNLTPNENTSIYVDYTYNQTGTYDVIVNVTNGINKDSETITVSMADLEVLNLSVLNSSGMKRKFEFIVKNYLNNQLNNVSWNINLGDGNKINSTNIILQPQENMSVYVDYTYSSANTYIVNASAMNGTLKGYNNITITVA